MSSSEGSSYSSFEQATLKSISRAICLGVASRTLVQGLFRRTNRRSPAPSMCCSSFLSRGPCSSVRTARFPTVRIYTHDPFLDCANTFPVMEFSHQRPTKTSRSTYSLRCISSRSCIRSCAQYTKYILKLLLPMFRKTSSQHRAL